MSTHTQQDHLIINLAKKEFINPAKFEEKPIIVGEDNFGFSGNGAMAALALLLVGSNKTDDMSFVGDWHIDEDTAEDLSDPNLVARFIGRWRGDPIAIIGDNAERKDLITGMTTALMQREFIDQSAARADRIHTNCLIEEDDWEDISAQMVELLAVDQDQYIPEKAEA